MKNQAYSLTVLATIFTTEDGKTFTDSGSNHEGISGTETIFIGLSKGEFFKVKAKLANIWLFLNGDLTGISSILSSWITRVNKDSLILIGDTTTGEFEGTTCTESIGTGSNGCSSSPCTFCIS